MHLDYDDHFQYIVIEAWQAYLAAETALSAAIGNHALVDTQRFAALREGAAATFFLHHYAELVIARKPPELPANITDHKTLRTEVAAHCFMLRSKNHVDDVALLGDVADSLKHSILINQNRNVASADAVLVVGSGYGVMAFGEGKMGGTDQVLILAKTGTRALSSVLQNVIDAWRIFFGWNISEIGQR